MASDTEALDRQIILERALATERARSLSADLITLNAKQWQFVNVQHPARFVMIRGLNRGGKSTVNLLKNNWHLTGRYPTGFTGPRHREPVLMILAGETVGTTRDLLVNRLLGKPLERGTGFIPADCFDPDRDIIYVSGGVKHQVDYFRVRHETDGIFDGHSEVYVKSYESDPEKFQGYQAHRVLLDEEPPEKILDECLARVLETEGYVDISNTATKGYTAVQHRFETSGDSYFIIDYGLDDAEHWSAAKKQNAIDTFGGTSTESARLYGPPARGVGLIYPTPDVLIEINPFEIPVHWLLIIGVDFPHTRGTFACVKLAYDKANDIVYLIDEYSGTGEDQSLYIDRLRRMGGDRIPVAWPHDGGRGAAGENNDGSSLAEVYRSHGIRMLPVAAHQIDINGRMSKEVRPVIEDIGQRMNSGRFKVFASCPGYFAEKRAYQQKDGRPMPKQNDHRIDATHKAMMSLRYAEAEAGRGGRNSEKSRMIHRIQTGLSRFDQVM